MNFLLSQICTALFFGGLIWYYSTIGNRKFGARTCGYVLGQLLSNNNWRAGLGIIIAIVLSFEAVIVYASYGFPRSPLVEVGQDTILPVLIEHGAGIFNRLVGEKYFDGHSYQEALVFHPGASWWWLIASCLSWFMAIVYLPISLRDEVWGFFHRLKTISGTVSAKTDDPKPPRKRSEIQDLAGPRGLKGWFWYLFDELIIEGVMTSLKKIGGK